MVQKYIFQIRIIILVLFVGFFHILLLFISPDDEKYPGVILFPLGIADLFVIYTIFKRVARAQAHPDT